MRGRTPKPAILARLAGDRRALKKNSVELPFAIPVAPDWLSAEAKAEWDELTPMLARMRVMTEADKIALAQLADTIARWKYVGEKLKHTYVLPVKDSSGEVVTFRRSPLVSIHMEYGLIIQKILIQFGLTPSARARLVNDEKTEIDTVFSRRAAEENA